MAGLIQPNEGFFTMIIPGVEPLAVRVQIAFVDFAWREPVYIRGYINTFNLIQVRLPHEQFGPARGQQYRATG